MINLFVQAFLIADKEEAAWLQSYEEIESEDFENLSEEQREERRKEFEEQFRAFGVLGKLHNIVVHIRASPQRTKAFEARSGRRIPLDNCTRWNSWYIMLAIALELQIYVQEYINANLGTISKSDVLQPQDWQLLETVKKFLECFKSATLMLEGRNVTLDQVIPTMDILRKNYENTLV